MIVIEDELKENVVHITGTRRFILFTFFSFYPVSSPVRLSISIRKDLSTKTNRRSSRYTDVTTE